MNPSHAFAEFFGYMSGHSFPADFGLEIGEETVIVGDDGGEYVVGDEQVDVGAADDAKSVERLLSAAVSGEEVGRIVRRSPARMTVRRTAPVRVQVRAPIQVPGRRPELEYYPLGFDSGADIPAGSSLDVKATPETAYWNRRLIVPSDICGQFVITGIRVGMKNAMPGTSAIPCRAYSEVSGGRTLILPKCDYGHSITLTVSNIGGGPARFRAYGEGNIADTGVGR
jgi:hypothetical protein